MIPNYFIPMDSIPLTTSGKVDKKKLPLPARSRSRSSVTYVEPKTDTEKVIAKIWAEVLKVDQPGIEDNFFDIGGNSLSIIQVGSRLNTTLGVNIPVVTMFKYPTINALAEYLSEEASSPEVVAEEQKETVEMRKNRAKNSIQRLRVRR